MPPETQLADAPAASKPPRRGKPPVIDPSLVTLNSDGFAWRTFLIRLPQGMTAADLSDPNIWMKVQVSKWCLRKFDRLFLVAFNEDWVADVMVTSADGKRAVLGKPKIEAMPDRYDKPLETDDYRVEFVGGGRYAVFRKSDGHRMTEPAATLQFAERDLQNLYPSRQ